MSDAKGPHSVTRKPRGFTVAPSPLNTVKFELGVIIIILPLIWLVVGRVVVEIWLQLSILLGAALLAMVWLIIRTRRAMKRWESEKRGIEADGAQQE